MSLHLEPLSRKGASWLPWKPCLPACFVWVTGGRCDSKSFVWMDFLWAGRALCIPGACMYHSTQTFFLLLLFIAANLRSFELSKSAHLIWRKEDKTENIMFSWYMAAITGYSSGSLSPFHSPCAWSCATPQECVHLGEDAYCTSPGVCICVCACMRV